MSLLPKKSTERPSLWKKGQSGNPNGRPKGARTRPRIGKTFGAVNKSMLEQARLKKLLPLDFMLEVLRNPKDYPFVARQWAAKEASPYIHKRMPIAIEGGDSPLNILNLDPAALAKLTTKQLEAIAAALDQLGITGDGD